MSGFIPGLAAPSIPLYENDTPVITGEVLDNLQADNLPVDGTLQYTLLNPINVQNPAPLLDYLVEVILELTVDVPAGEVETSTIEITVSGNFGRPVNFSRDFGTGLYTGYTSGAGTEYLGNIGFLRIFYNEPILIQIKRMGGNPAVTMSLEQIFKKFKRLN